MIGSITCDTPLDQILNISDVNDALDEVDNAAQKFYKPFQDAVQHEMTNGGLDKFSLNIMGTAPANEKANSVLQKVDEAQSEIHSVSSSILQKAKKQRTDELNKLKQAITDKIEQLKMQQETAALQIQTADSEIKVYSNLEDTLAMDLNIAKAKSNKETARKSLGLIKAQIETYQKKLESVEAMLGTVAGFHQLEER